MRNLLNIILFFGFIAVLSACSSDEDKVEEALDSVETSVPAEDIFAEARKEMQAANYARAIELFGEVERLYPFSELAPKSRVMIAYSHFKDEEYDKAIDTINSFIDLNPGSKEIQFMYYLKAISYYDRIKDVRRDQDVTEKAKTSFEEILRRFPDSQYAKEAKYKLTLIRSHLAGKEMEVGRFYAKRKNYIAALNRYKEVLNQYDDTEQAEEALYRLVETNLILGIDSEAIKYAGILGYNYPSSKWYKRSYRLIKGDVKTEKTEEDDGFFSFLSFSDDEDEEAPELKSEGDNIKIDDLFDKETGN
ncbi:MAG: outer membrane protein assembly factor BamD [Rickettsiales bacterium]|nr:outer membrane protein assembly factor BamD [Rickettsiales bacterium]